MSLRNRLETELTDAQIEAIVADAIATEASSARAEAMPPSSAIVWWRAQMRARQEAAHAVERPLTIVHGLAIACAAGLALSLIGTAVAGVRASTGWLLGVYQSLRAALAPLSAVDFSSGWMMVPMTAILLSLVAASLAAVFILVDE